ncbi:MAG: amidohydrolase [Desulfobacterales bacterium]|nr:amidohydrolase [Desulfobacterales bacterium]
MITDLKTTLIQTDLVWENVQSNLAFFNDEIDRIQEETDLIVLPEMFNTGFSMNVEKLAEDIHGTSINWIQQKSLQKKTDIVGSLIFKKNHKYYNRLIWAKPSGKIFTYDKKHLFRMSDENQFYSAGDKSITVELNGWKIKPFICYDLRFPIWLRNRGNLYDIAIFVANWPARRSAHWKILLQARAVENQCYVIGVNRVGMDGKGNRYSGDSSIIDPLGKIIFQKSDEACTYTATLSYSILQEYRTSFPAWMDADDNQEIFE